jgi:hypothetical protein
MQEQLPRMTGMRRVHGQIIAPALSAFPTSMWVMHRSRDVQGSDCS